MFVNAGSSKMNTNLSSDTEYLLHTIGNLIGATKIGARPKFV